MDNSDPIQPLLDRLAGEDTAALGELFEHYRERLWRMISLRLDARVARRVSADDVLQEAFLDVSSRISEYVANPAVPFYVWLRFLVIQRLQQVHRFHLKAGMRDAGREAPLPGEGAFVSAGSIVGDLVGHLTSPSQAAIRDELRLQLKAALDSMEPMDREILALRHIEELSNVEVAAVLGITREAASKRHIRALKRLTEIVNASGVDL